MALLVLVGSLIGPRVWLQASTFRPKPDPVYRMLFPGVRYIREVRNAPRPLIVHIIMADLQSPGLRFLVTPPEPAKGRQLRARTTSEFLGEYDVQVAVNGDFFLPWWANCILDYYPHSGDPVDVIGYAASEGMVYSQGRANHPTLYISEDNIASFDAPIGPVYNAISGNLLFVVEGQPQTILLTESYHQSPQPRAALALDETGQILIIVAVDGRQPDYSEGVSMTELAEIVIQYGGDTALNLDGGGSVALVVAGADGRPMLLNSPIQNYMPTWERPVGNHLGIYAPAD